MTTEANQPTANQPTAAGDIVARAGRYYRNTRYIMLLLLVGGGAWFLRDGFIKYPRENAIVEELKSQQRDAQRTGDEEKLKDAEANLHEHASHSQWDIAIQYALGFALPPIGLAMLWWAMHRSRGEYRLSGTKLSVPGHPTIDLDDIQKADIDNELWDRKGIVWLPYKTADGQEGEIVLDDFIYDRPPTDAIYDRIAEKFGLKVDEDSDDDEDLTDSETQTTDAE